MVGTGHPLRVPHPLIRRPHRDLRTGIGDIGRGSSGGRRRRIGLARGSGDSPAGTSTRSGTDSAATAQLIRLRIRGWDRGRTGHQLLRRQCGIRLRELGGRSPRVDRRRRPPGRGRAGDLGRRGGRLRRGRTTVLPRPHPHPPTSRPRRPPPRTGNPIPGGHSGGTGPGGTVRIRPIRSPGPGRRQPEGGRGQDDDIGQPRRSAGRARLPGPGHRSRSPGKCHDRTGDRRPELRTLDVRRPHAGLRRSRTASSRPA